jgi:ABC-type proline/glycine betaine transport system permease subunit
MHIKSIISHSIGICTLSLAPLVTYAQRRTPQNFRDVVGLVLNLLEMTIPIILSFALLVFFWGLAKMVWHGGNERQYAEGRSIAFYGVIALFVMLSVWGIVSVLENTFLGIQGPPVGGA